MDPKQTKDQDRSATGTDPREQQKKREEKPAMPGPGERKDPSKGKVGEDPSAIPENNQPFDDKNRPGGQKGSPQRPQPEDPQNPGVDTLKPGR